MTKYTIIVNNDNEFPVLDILNLNISDYFKIIKSFEELIELLTIEITDDEYYEKERKKVLSDYKELLKNLKTNELPDKGQAISIEDNIIEKLKRK